MRKFLALLLVLMLVLTLAACGGKDAQKPSGGKTKQPTSTESTDKPGNSPGKDYATCYAFYSEMTNKLSQTILEIVENNNTRLEEENPEGYFNDPSYLMLFLYLPFLSIDMAFTAAVTDTVEPAAIAMTYAFLGIDDVSFTVLSPGNYKITFTTKDREDETITKHVEETMKYEKESIRYVQRVDGEVDEFYEFISLGGDRYAIQSKNARAIVTYKDGQIIQVLHSDNMYEMDRNTGNLTEWSVVYDPDSDSAWGRKDLDEDWVLELESSGGLERIYELKNGTLTISGQKSKYDWETDETSYEPMEPIVIPAK